MINTPKKLKLGIMRSYTPHVGNKLKRIYDVHTIPVPITVRPVCYY
jgi:hypothetical protein